MKQFYYTVENRQMHIFVYRHIHVYTFPPLHSDICLNTTFIDIAEEL